MSQTLRLFVSLFSLCLMISLSTFAADGNEPVPGLVEAIARFFAAIPTDGMLVTLAGLVFGFVSEQIVRRRPTAKPQGWLYWMASVIEVVCTGLLRVCALLRAVGQSSDRVLGQQLKAPAPPPEQK